MNDTEKEYSIHWSTIASGTHKVKAKDEDEACGKLIEDIKNLKVRVEFLDMDEVDIDTRDIKEEQI